MSNELSIHFPANCVVTDAKVSSTLFDSNDFSPSEGSDESASMFFAVNPHPHVEDDEISSTFAGSNLSPQSSNVESSIFFAIDPQLCDEVSSITFLGCNLPPQLTNKSSSMWFSGGCSPSVRINGLLMGSESVEVLTSILLNLRRSCELATAAWYKVRLLPRRRFG